MTDTVEFQIVKTDRAEGQDAAQLDEFNVEVRLNGKILLDRALFNFGAIPDFHSICEDIDLYTCSCGVPGCAGFNGDVKHIVAGDRVRWIFRDSEGGHFSAVAPREYSFDKGAFLDAVEGLKSGIQSMVDSGVKPHVHLDDGDGEDTILDAAGLAERHRRDVEWHDERIAENAEIAAMFDGHDFARRILFEAGEAKHEGWRMYSFVGKMCNYTYSAAKVRNAIALLDRMRAGDGAADAIFAKRMRKLYGAKWIRQFCWQADPDGGFRVSFPD